VVFPLIGSHEFQGPFSGFLSLSVFFFLYKFFILEAMFVPFGPWSSFGGPMCKDSRLLREMMYKATSSLISWLISCLIQLAYSVS
jgi:hypothetical protein